MPVPPSSSGVAITNPLVLYRSLIATRRIRPDPAQHRLAIQLQKLYERLIDYEPIVQYGYRLTEISKALGTSPGQIARHGSARPGQEWQDARDSEGISRSRGVFSSLFERQQEKESLALTRVLTSHQAAMEMDSPKGLMLHGEVGTGKSMLIDLFADCLPTRKKKRRHFNTFILETLAKLEQLRRSRQLIIPTSLGIQEDYSLLWLARDMISTSPIIFLDEFQLPDRAASKIMTNLMTCFFQLGGVLIATSNRMPEELAKAAGMEFVPPPSRLDSLTWKLGLGGRPTGRTEAYSGQADFAKFLEVLKTRCDIWEMESTKDYRRTESDLGLESNEQKAAQDRAVADALEGLEDMVPGNVGLGFEQSRKVEEPEEPHSTQALPSNYFVKPKGIDEAASEEWTKSFRAAQLLAFGPTAAEADPIPWQQSSMKVYGRDIVVHRQHKGVTLWTFQELCVQPFGPADYITLASTFHTIILTDVPILSLLQRNEARRFITLLDALYEARCKLLITADAGPDNIFFPERLRSSSSTSSSNQQETVDEDAIQPETFAEAYQDMTAPFRPNVASYDDPSASSFVEPTISASTEPDYTHARFQGILSNDQLEDGPPNKPAYAGRGDSIHGLDTSLEYGSQGSGNKGPDFSRTGAFTGEDEKFAYKRARSRLWEMCGTRWWARQEEGWWTPVDASVRPWEGEGISALPTSELLTGSAQNSVEETERTKMQAMERMGDSREVAEDLDPTMFKHGASPFRTSKEPPPKFSWTHVWGMMRWGKKAGIWGKGVEGWEERKKEKEEGEKRDQRQ